jgi:hypothetical protein
VASDSLESEAFVGQANPCASSRYDDPNTQGKTDDEQTAEHASGGKQDPPALVDPVDLPALLSLSYGLIHVKFHREADYSSGQPTGTRPTPTRESWVRRDVI